MAASDSANFPGPSVPIDQDGNIFLSQPWVQFLVALLIRTGGNGVPNTDFADLLAQIKTAQAQIDYQSVQQQDPQIQAALRGIDDLLSQIPQTANLTEVFNRLEVLERLLSPNPDSTQALRRSDELEAMLADIRVAAPPVLEQWNAPTFTNGWGNFGSPYNTAGYWKDPFGIVHMRGLIASGTVGASAFTLPVGYRPVNREVFVTISNSAVGYFQIDSNGTVILLVGSNVYGSLDGITFRAAT